MNPLRPSAVEKFIQLLASSFKISVIFEGEGAWAWTPDMENIEKKVIKLPAMPNPCPPDLEFYYIGLAYHECGHVLYTDFKAWDRAVSIPKEKRSFLLKTLTNIIEDYRIEHQLMEQFPGSGYYLIALYDKVHAENILEFNKPPKKMPDGTLSPDPKTQLGALMMGIMDRIYKRDSAAYDSHWLSVLATLASEIEDARNCASTEEAILLAQKMEQKILQNQEAAAQNKRASDLERQAEEVRKKMQEIERALRNAYSGYGAEQQLKELEGRLQELQDKQGSAKLKTQVTLALQVIRAARKSAAKAAQVKGISNLKRDPFDKKFFVPYTTANDEVITKFHIRGDEKKRYDNYRSELASEASYLSQRFRALLRAKVPSRWLLEQPEGHLDPYRLVSAKVEQNRDVFMSLRPGLKLDVGLLILVDESGSMDHNKARQALILLAEALDAVQIPFEIIGFTTTGTSAGGPVDLSLYQRYIGLSLRVYKAFKDQYKKVKTNLVHVQNSGYTPLPCSMLFALKRLITQKYARKILLVITDGEPCYGNHSLDEKAYMTNLQEAASRAGIETMAIGLTASSAAVQRYFKDFVLYKDIKQLPQYLIKKMETVFYGKDAKRPSA